jgi:hypothetical protein
MAPSSQGSLSSEPTIHKALRDDGPSGAVEWWDDLTEDDALVWRKQGRDIVVRGPDKKRNREKAKEIEAGVGPWVHHGPHARGSLSLPHYQQAVPPPAGHSFYEVDTRKARKKS